MSLKRGRDVVEQDSNTSRQVFSIFESSTIEDRASKFVAVFSPEVAPRALQARAPYKAASHRILAWRRPSKQQSLLPSPNAPGKLLYDVGHDDDGEKYAGKKLANLLTDMNVVGTVVVARWYGGVLLGPTRFDHIVNVAKEAIVKWHDSIGEGIAAKKLKVDEPHELTPEEEVEQKQRLVKQLENRDSSIKVLRDLLAEKKATLSQTSNDKLAMTQTSPDSKIPSAPKYDKMPLKALKQLEKAKDTTISWILKQIDEAERTHAGDLPEAHT